ISGNNKNKNDFIQQIENLMDELACKIKPVVLVDLVGTCVLLAKPVIDLLLEIWCVRTAVVGVNIVVNFVMMTVAVFSCDMLPVEVTDVVWVIPLTPAASTM
ncbi:hypothetical protein HK096_007870, partial [Nowakowskiella sp. JEL0078]